MNIFSEVKQYKTIFSEITQKTVFSEITQNKSVRDLIYDFKNNHFSYFTQTSKYAMDHICTVLYLNISAKDPKNRFIYNSHRTYTPFSYDNIKTKSINKRSKFDSSQNIFHF